MLKVAAINSACQHLHSARGHHGDVGVIGDYDSRLCGCSVLN